jgi:hypothetical protein
MFEFFLDKLSVRINFFVLNILLFFYLKMKINSIFSNLSKSLIKLSLYYDKNFSKVPPWYKFLKLHNILIKLIKF